VTNRAQRKGAPGNGIAELPEGAIKLTVSQGIALQACQAEVNNAQARLVAVLSEIGVAAGASVELTPEGVLIPVQAVGREPEKPLAEEN
jgi:hypothetical protein